MKNVFKKVEINKSRTFFDAEFYDEIKVVIKTGTCYIKLLEYSIRNFLDSSCFL